MNEVKSLLTDIEAEQIVNRIWKQIYPLDEEIVEEFNDTFDLFSSDDVESQAMIVKIQIVFLMMMAKKRSEFTDFKKLDAYFDEVADSIDEAPLFRFFGDLLNYYSDNQSEWKRLIDASEEYTYEQLQLVVLKANFYDYGNEERVPQSIVECVNTFLEIQPDDVVAEVSANYGEYVIDSKQSFPDVEFSVIDDGGHDCFPQLGAYMRAEALSLRRINYYDYAGKPGIATKVFVNEINPNIYNYRPQSLLQNNWSDFPCQDNEKWSVCAAGIVLTGFKGKVTTIMDASDLTVKVKEHFRKMLCDEGFIEGVIALPDKLYRGTWIYTYLVIMSPNNKTVKFLDARNSYVVNRNNGKRVHELSREDIDRIYRDYNDEKIVTVIPVKEIAENNYNLSPLRYVEDDGRTNDVFKLADIISSSKRGMTLKAAEMDEYITSELSEIRCIKPAHISSGIITDYEYYHGELKKPDKNMAHRGDILISKVGTPFKIAVADADYLVIGNIYIVSLNGKELNPEYVSIYLNSKAGQDQIRKLAVGSATPILNISDLGNILIPVFDAEQQKELLERTAEMHSELKKMHLAIRNIQKEANDMFDDISMNNIISFTGARDEAMKRRYTKMVMVDIKRKYPAEKVEKLDIYIKEDEGKIYYTVNGIADSIDL